MSNLNLSMLDGYLAQDPKILTTKNGQVLCQFTIGNNRNYRTPKGKWMREVNFFDLLAREDLAEKCSRFKKGNRVFVSGSLKRHDWTDKTGISQVKYYIEIKDIDVFI